MMKKIYRQDKRVLSIKVNVTATLRDALTGKVKRVIKDHNLVVTDGKEIVAEFLGRVTPSITSLSPNYCAVGTSSTPAAASDAQLGAEIDRTVVASRSHSGAIAYLTGFFGATDGNGTLREVGLFINGSASANTGILFNRVIINVTKSSSETLTIDFVITVT